MHGAHDDIHNTQKDRLKTILGNTNVQKIIAI